MANVAQAFQQYLSDLELTDPERTRASRQQEEVRGRLHQALGGVRTSLLMGSYRRGTAIRPLDDIDVFVQLDDAAHGGYRYSPPLRLLERIHRALVDSYPSHKPRIQGRSVHIDFTGTGIGYDIVPAFAIGSVAPGSEPDQFEIPDRHHDTWVKTNPRAHREACINANKQAGDMLNGLIKAVKHWNREHGGKLKLRSFHLEVMSYSAFSAKPANPRRGLMQLFTHLADRVLTPCADPAGLGPAINADLTDNDRLDARTALKAASKAAAAAVLSEANRDDAAACAAWRQLLGPTFRY